MTKDRRKLDFKEHLQIGNVQLDLCSIIEHLGASENSGHYLCARRNFIITQPFLSERDLTDQAFCFTNWSLVSDERSL